VTATVTGDASGTIVNTATTHGPEFDPDLSNNTASRTVHVTPGRAPSQPLTW
jgi:hypothetical protein